MHEGCNVVCTYFGWHMAVQLFESCHTVRPGTDTRQTHLHLVHTSIKAASPAEHSGAALLIGRTARTLERMSIMCFRTEAQAREVDKGLGGLQAFHDTTVALQKSVWAAEAQQLIAQQEKKFEEVGVCMWVSGDVLQITVHSGDMHWAERTLDLGRKTVSLRL